MAVTYVCSQGLFLNFADVISSLQCQLELEKRIWSWVARFGVFEGCRKTVMP